MWTFQKAAQLAKQAWSTDEQLNARDDRLGVPPRLAPVPAAQVFQNQSNFIQKGLATGRLPIGDIVDNAYRNVGGVEEVARIARAAGNPGATPENLRTSRPIGQQAGLRSGTGVKLDGVYTGGRLVIEKTLAPAAQQGTVMHEMSHAMQGTPIRPPKQWTPYTPPIAAPSPTAGTAGKYGVAQQQADPHAFRRQYYRDNPGEAQAEFFGPVKRLLAAHGVLARTPAEVPGVLRGFDQKFPNYFQDAGKKQLWQELQNPQTAPKGADPATQYLRVIKAPAPVGMPAVKMATALPQLVKTAASWALRITD